jgi:hypothetical protein
MGRNGQFQLHTLKSIPLTPPTQDTVADQAFLVTDFPRSALRIRANPGYALSGLFWFILYVPRALPWAFMFSTLRAVSTLRRRSKVRCDQKNFRCPITIRFGSRPRLRGRD